jgi:hypothetical protein
MIPLKQSTCDWSIGLANLYEAKPVKEKGIV